MDVPDSPVMVSDSRPDYMSSDEEYGEEKVVPDELYNEGKDDEDEAWVYKNLRGGVEEDVTLKLKGGDVADSSKEQVGVGEGKVSSKTVAALKPRDSDAVLSCPCCFHILCMDCQKHDRYANQFRAMFVIDVKVDWASKWVEDWVGGEEGNSEVEGGREKGSYYHVHCGRCSTKVAALNMDDEVYHFYGCIASH